MKKTLVIIIATVLVLGVIGGCFALYYTGADPVTVNIAADYEAFTLQIKDGAGTADQGAINLTFDPETNATKTVDLTLTVDHKTLVDGNHGVFKVAVTSEDGLDNYIVTTVNTLTAAQGSVSADISTAAKSAAGYDVALSATPIYVRLTFALNADAIADFSLVAEKTASLAITWEVSAASVWTYNATTYYLVGTINGQDKWSVTPANQNIALSTEGVSGNNIAIATNVSLTAGDEIKVVWNYKGEDADNDGNADSSQWYGSGNNNVVITTTGVYNIFLYNNNGYNVSAALVE